MNGKTKDGWLIALALVMIGSAQAGQVVVEQAEFTRGSGNEWRAAVTLRHADTGWDHYADGWRVLDKSGKVLGHRTLFHPHVHEQPFTRSHTMLIPPTVKQVFVEAHDKVHGWAPQRLPVELDQAVGIGAATRR